MEISLTTKEFVCLVSYKWSSLKLFNQTLFPEVSFINVSFINLSRLMRGPTKKNEQNFFCTCDCE